MAAIDHTIIAFKNGKLMKATTVFKDDGQCVSLIPFSYTRDGKILGYELWKANPLRAHSSVLDGLRRLFSKKEDFPQFYSYLDKTVEIILCRYDDFNVSFYFDAENSYVLLGGYGHYLNPYTHFYHRGYGETFERKMAQECFDWLCHDILEFAVRSIPGYRNEAEHHLQRLQTRLGFKDYFELSEAERARRDAEGMAYYDPAAENDRLSPAPVVNGSVMHV